MTSLASPCVALVKAAPLSTAALAYHELPEDLAGLLQQASTQGPALEGVHTIAGVLQELSSSCLHIDRVVQHIQATAPFVPEHALAARGRFAQLALHRYAVRRMAALASAGGGLSPRLHDSIASCLTQAAHLLRQAAPEHMTASLPLFLLHHSVSLVPAHVEQGPLQGALQDLVAACVPHFTEEVLTGLATHEVARLAATLPHTALAPHRGELGEALLLQYADRLQGVAGSAAPFAGTLRLPGDAEHIIVTLRNLVQPGTPAPPALETIVQALLQGGGAGGTVLAAVPARCVAMLASTLAVAGLPQTSLHGSMGALLQAVLQHDVFRIGTASGQRRGAAARAATPAPRQAHPHKHLPLLLHAVTRSGLRSPALRTALCRALTRGRPLARTAVFKWHTSHVVTALLFLAEQGESLAGLRHHMAASPGPLPRPSSAARAAQQREGLRGLQHTNTCPVQPLLDALARNAADVLPRSALTSLHALAALGMTPAEAASQPALPHLAQLVSQEVDCVPMPEGGCNALPLLQGHLPAAVFAAQALVALTQAAPEGGDSGGGSGVEGGHDSLPYDAMFMHSGTGAVTCGDDVEVRDMGGVGLAAPLHHTLATAGALYTAASRAAGPADTPRQGPLQVVHGNIPAAWPPVGPCVGQVAPPTRLPAKADDRWAAQMRQGSVCSIPMEGWQGGVPPALLRPGHHAGDGPTPDSAFLETVLEGLSAWRLLHGIVRPVLPHLGVQPEVLFPVQPQGQEPSLVALRVVPWGDTVPTRRRGAAACSATHHAAAGHVGEGLPGSVYACSRISVENALLRSAGVRVVTVSQAHWESWRHPPSALARALAQVGVEPCRVHSL